MSPSLPTPAFLYILNIFLSPTLPKFPFFHNCHATPKRHGLPPPPPQILNVHQEYVGETELEFHCRMNNHKSDIRSGNKSNGMVRHFSKCGIDNVTPNILEKVRSRDHYIRKAREQYYIEPLEPQINAQ